MRLVKRFFYFTILNIIVSAVTILVVLQLWEPKHPTTTADSTPVVIVVTPTQSTNLPLIANNSGADGISPTEAGTAIGQSISLTPSPEMLTYQVKEGDTLGTLAVEFNVRISDILAVNELADPDRISIGQILYIPTAPLPEATSTSIPPTIMPTATYPPSATATQGPHTTATATAMGQEPQMAIAAVIGAGDLETEHVQLLRTGDGELSLNGWRLEDGKGNVYNFPDLTLFNGRTINLNTRSGQDTVIDLFWGLASPIWQPGKVVSLYDDQNVLRASYVAP